MALPPKKLNHVGAKIARSIDHLKTLNEEIDRFLSNEPCVLVSEFKPQERAYLYRVKITRDVPLPIRILTGEVLYHLRSSLDHLAWQLAALTCVPNAPPETTEFPVFKNRKSYLGKRTSKINALPAAAKDIVDRLQPYLDAVPEDATLWRLHRLTNDDKHRLPHLVAAAPSGIVAGPRNGRDMAIQMRIGPFDEQTEIGRVEFLNPGETDVEVQTDVRFDLAFPANSAGRGMPVRSELVRYGQRVAGIVRKFEKFF